MQHVPRPPGRWKQRKKLRDQESEAEEEEKRDRSYCNSYWLPLLLLLPRVGRTSFCARRCRGSVVDAVVVVAPGVVSLKSNQPRLNAQPKTQTQLPTWAPTAALSGSGKPAVSCGFDTERDDDDADDPAPTHLATRPQPPLQLCGKTQTKLREILQRIFI